MATLLRGSRPHCCVADNFYMNGCNSTAGDQGGNCAERFQEAWTNMYQIPAMSAINGLTWYGSLGNHDMLGRLS